LLVVVDPEEKKGSRAKWEKKAEQCRRGSKSAGLSPYGETAKLHTKRAENPSQRPGEPIPLTGIRVKRGKKPVVKLLVWGGGGSVGTVWERAPSGKAEVRCRGGQKLGTRSGQPYH